MTLTCTYLQYDINMHQYAYPECSWKFMHESMTLRDVKVCQHLSCYLRSLGIYSQHCNVPFFFSGVEGASPLPDPTSNNFSFIFCHLLFLMLLE